jgi:glucose 1-dehydrogenase
MLLVDKNAIIVGGARGMGGATALKFADEGCNCVIADVLDQEGARTVEEIKKKGRDAVFAHCDVSDISQVKAAIDGAIARFKKVDVMVIAAGIGVNPTPLENITDKEFDKVMAVNCKGTFLCIQAVAPHLMQNKSGNIICIASVAAIECSPINWHYFASKSAQWAIARNAAATLAPYGVRVNIIHPGMILTDMSTVFAGPTIKDVAAHQAAIAQRAVPMKKMGYPEDVAKVALFLASDLASYVTGESICVSGGAGLLAGAVPL